MSSLPTPRKPRVRLTLAALALMLTACSVNPVPLDPPQFIATQIELLLRGLVK